MKINKNLEIVKIKDFTLASKIKREHMPLGLMCGRPCQRQSLISNIFYFKKIEILLTCTLLRLRY